MVSVQQIRAIRAANLARMRAECPPDAQSKNPGNHYGNKGRPVWGKFPDGSVTKFNSHAQAAKQLGFKSSASIWLAAKSGKPSRGIIFSFTEPKNG